VAFGCSELSTATELETPADLRPAFSTWSPWVEEDVAVEFDLDVDEEFEELEDPDHVDGHYRCPPTIRHAEWNWRTHGFKVGPWQHSGLRPRSVAPLNGAYTGPSGTHKSLDGLAEVTGNKTAQVRCATRAYLRLQVPGMTPLYAYVGYVTFSTIRATYRELEPDPPPLGGGVDDGECYYCEDWVWEDADGNIVDEETVCWEIDYSICEAYGL
jgi:hypothetical protein